jgi:hypothetical protein
MEAYIGTTPTPRKSETADVAALLHAHLNDNRHAHAARNGGNGHCRRVRRQVRRGYRRAVRRADTAVTLVESGMSVTEAIERCEIRSAYFYAMKAVKESEDLGLYHAVLRNETPLFPSAKRVKNAAAVIKAYRRCSLFEQGMVWLAVGVTSDLERLLRCSTPEQLAETSKRLGLDWVWDHLIAAAMPSEANTEANTVPAAATSTTNVKISQSPGYASRWVASLPDSTNNSN